MIQRSTFNIVKITKKLKSWISKTQYGQTYTLKTYPFIIKDQWKIKLTAKTTLITSISEEVIHSVKSTTIELNTIILKIIKHKILNLRSLRTLKPTSLNTTYFSVEEG